MRAYVLKSFYSGFHVGYIETPALNRWVQISGYTKTEKEAVDWLTDLGYKVVTKEESYERSEKSSGGSP